MGDKVRHFGVHYLLLLRDCHFLLEEGAGKVQASGVFVTNLTKSDVVVHQQESPSCDFHLFFHVPW